MTTVAAAAPDVPQSSSTYAVPPGRFEVVGTFSTHLSRDPLFHATNAGVFTRRVQQEWRLLRRDTPPGVIVKTTEDEMHLFKVCILGAMHTPYYQGFYCFDIRLPNDYPMSPPIVTFHSKGHRMNPNLYNDGYVCLSLLGTWDGHDACERWNPTHSNLIQVILAIQSFILCKEPYYNEAGYERKVGTRDGRLQSRLTNELMYVAKWTHLVDMAKATPTDWAHEFRAHFTQCVPWMLQRARGYLSTSEAASRRAAVDDATTATSAVEEALPGAAAVGTGERNGSGHRGGDQHDDDDDDGGAAAADVAAAAPESSSGGGGPSRQPHGGHDHDDANSSSTTPAALSTSSSRAPTEGDINADGLVWPWSRGFIHSLQRYVDWLTREHLELTTVWDAEYRRIASFAD